MAPTTLAYTIYLLRTALSRRLCRGTRVDVTVLLIYAEVGKALIERGSPNAMYQKWIETYAGEDSNALVDAVLDVVDHACEDLNPPQQAKVTEAFVTHQPLQMDVLEHGLDVGEVAGLENSVGF